jgi:hypothetical protein
VLGELEMIGADPVERAREHTAVVEHDLDGAPVLRQSAQRPSEVHPGAHRTALLDRCPVPQTRDRAHGSTGYQHRAALLVLQQ